MVICKFSETSKEQKMANLPPINSVVKVIKTVAEQDQRLGQTGTVIQYSGHRKSLCSFLRYANWSRNFFNGHNLKILES
jgi:hypothetical protein